MLIESLAEALAAEGIKPRDLNEGDQKLICPKCSHTRRSKTETCLSLSIDAKGARWKCHHCNDAGFFISRDPAYRPSPARSQPVKYTTKPSDLPAFAIAYFAERDISEDSLRYAGVGWSDPRRAVMFPYFKPGDSGYVNAKFRRLPKDGFSQIKDGEKIYWLIDKADPQVSKDIYIVEGEIDALSLIEAGIPNVISVPDGAPKEVGQGGVNSTKFSFVSACDEWIEPFDRVIIAADADEPGFALAEELSRRYGKDRCWLVDWPKGTKDANDFLIQYGKAALGEHCRKPRPCPVDGLFTVANFEADVISLYENGRARGISTGYPSIDPLYTIAPGQLTVVTGIPNHGKSEFIDQIMVNLAQREKWSFGVCSFENDPPNHISKMAEKWIGAPFWDGPHPRMTQPELLDTIDWLNDHFHFMRCEGEDAPTLDWILTKARILVKRFGIRGLVIDPYNEIEHKRPGNMTETEYVSFMLAQIKRFASAHGVHVWFVAHPAKMRPADNGKVPVPTLYDISGSANFVNKTDCGIVINRGDVENTTDIWVRKVRFKWVGKQGRNTLGYNRITGIYSDLGFSPITN